MNQKFIFWCHFSTWLQYFLPIKELTCFININLKNKTSDILYFCQTIPWKDKKQQNISLYLNT